MKKFELIPSDRDGMFRIKAVRDVAGLSTVYGRAQVFKYAHVSDSYVSGNAIVSDYAQLLDGAYVSDNAYVRDYAYVIGTHVAGNARVSGRARVSSIDDYIVFKNWWSSGRYFTWTRSDDMWSVGCFHGTGDELVAKAYKDSTLSGRGYERCVRYVQALLDESE